MLATKTVHEIMSKVVTLKCEIIESHPEHRTFELKLPWYKEPERLSSGRGNSKCKA